MGTDFSAQAVELRELAKARNAVILAHNYQRAEVQDGGRLRRRLPGAVAQGRGDATPT